MNKPILTKMLTAFLLSAGAMLFARPQVDYIAIQDAKEVYNPGDTVVIALNFDEEIEDIILDGDKYPELELNVKTLTSASRKAVSYGSFNERGMFFQYTVEPGDYTAELDVKSAGTLIFNGAKVQFVNGETITSATVSIGEIPSYDQVIIRTINLIDGSDFKPEVVKESMQNGVAEAFSIDYGGPLPVSGDIKFVVNPAGAATVTSKSGTGTLKMAVGDQYGDFTVTPEKVLPTGFTVTAYPYGVGKGGEIKLVVGETVVGPRPQLIMTAPSSVSESDTTDYEITLTPPRKVEVPVTVRLTADDTTAIMFPAGNTLTFNANSLDPRIIKFKALDGNKSVNITATDVSGLYFDDVTCNVLIENVPPVIVVGSFRSDEPLPQDAMLPPGYAGFAYTVSWSSADVSAAANRIETRVNFGSGFGDWIKGPYGSASHIYTDEGMKTIILEMRDSEGGQVVRFALPVEISPATAVVIQESKDSSVSGGAPIPYKEFAGLGNGHVDDDRDDTSRTVVSGNSTFKILYPLNARSARLVATPEDFVLRGKTYNSFFHTWVGDEGKVPTQSLHPIAGNTTTVTLGDGENSEDAMVQAVFSREYYPEDGAADIDLDELPDSWEAQYFGSQEPYIYEANTRNDNPDFDFFPAGAVIDAGTGEMSYPARDFDYSPTGARFSNVYEVRGTHPGLNMAPNAFSEAVEPSDEPHIGYYDETGAFVDTDSRQFFGTDPTKADTDGDKLPDGFEYYFWRLAKLATSPVGEAYDPTRVIEGIPLNNLDIAELYNPVVAGGDFSHIDTDRDGLSDFEEMLLGTNPIHWDTDGDGMNDGWEVLWGLNPQHNDAGENPDGDYMALSGTLRHYEVYLANGFDPRTAWGEAYIGKDRTSKPVNSPNTAKYTNYEEHYLGRWCIDMGFTAAVNPLSRNFMTQPTPKETVVKNSSILDGNFSDTALTVKGSLSATSEDSASISIEQSATAVEGYDSDNDTVPDGWELYVCGPNREIWPVSPYRSVMPNYPSALDGRIDNDGDGMGLIEEFHGEETCSFYAGIDNYNERWWNKFWATDPWDPDTDGDGVIDSEEGASEFETRFPNMRFVYNDEGNKGKGTCVGTMKHGCHPGGMLNPCATDTDGDYLPDAWEWSYAGGSRDTAYAGGYIDGMDGTYNDSVSGSDTETGELRNYDFDGDGLQNYQEYLTGALYHFRYDAWVKGRDYGQYDMNDFFQPCAHEWDWCNDILGTEYRYIPVGEGGSVCSTSPMLNGFDSDSDGMDDYYEMYHGLNPLLGTFDLVGIATGAVLPEMGEWNYNEAPWLAGLPMADPDQDGIPNNEESLNPNEANPQNHHTDPSPLWMTDISNDKSFVNLYYGLGTVPMYWGEEVIEDFYYPEVLTAGTRPTYLYDFESNEGYDTDNDNISDKREIIGAGTCAVTDPLDFDKPRPRKALYLNGNAAARTAVGCGFGPHTFRSWTIEAWVRPEDPASGARQIILERPVSWPEQEDPMTKFEDVRRTFRLGIEIDGRPFVEYNNGGKECIVENATADKTYTLEANKWYHIAGVYSGLEKRLKLFVDGKLVVAKATANIPFNGYVGGVIEISEDPTNYVTGFLDHNRRIAVLLDTFEYRKAPIVLGASDSNPEGEVDGTTEILSNGGSLGVHTQPQLADFYKGWIDEVRIWHGARSDAEIKADFDALKRYTREDIIASRNQTVYQLQKMLMERTNIADEGKEVTVERDDDGEIIGGEVSSYTSDDLLYIEPTGYTFEQYHDLAVDSIQRVGGEKAGEPFPAFIVGHYSFDSLPDPNYETVIPEGFEEINGRDPSYEGVKWLALADDRTTVYRAQGTVPYIFPQYIQNTVSSLALGTLIAEPATFDLGNGHDAIVCTTGVYRADHSADSKFWWLEMSGNTSTDADGLRFAKNYFPNSANPYGHSFLTGRSTVSQNHPSVTSMSTYDSNYATLFNNMLPLRDAVADMSVQLWDDKTGTGYGTNCDSDGDGLPDWWELANGTDPFNADENGNGIRDNFDDFDGDGLSNWSEYLANTNPLAGDSDGNGINDFNDGRGLNNGFLFSDADRVSDIYEGAYENDKASTTRYDEHWDLDRDGWNNWLEYIAGTSLDYGIILNTLTNDAEATEGHVLGNENAGAYPMPTLNVTLFSNSPKAITGKLVVEAYSTPGMNGYPIAIYQKDIGPEESAWPRTAVLTSGDLKFGHLRAGATWFFAWIDTDSSALESEITDDAESAWLTWTDGEYAGVADNQLNGIDIGLDANNVTFYLTDKPSSSIRVNLTTLTENATGAETGDGEEVEDDEEGGVLGLADEYKVQVVNNGTVVFEKTLRWPRVVLHEGDIMAGKTSAFGLQQKPSYKGVPESTYDLYVNDKVFEGVWVNNFPTLALPVLTYPVGAQVYDARPTFRFTLAPEANEFIFELSKNGNVVYSQSHVTPARARNPETGKYDIVEWQFPFAAGARLPSGEIFDGNSVVYTWSVRAVTPAATSAAVSELFELKIDAENSVNNLKGVITAEVSYPSAAVGAFANGATADIRVQAFKSSSLSGLPVAEATIAGVTAEELADKVTVTLAGLKANEPYYVMAYVDQDNDLERDTWESYGYLRVDDASVNAYKPKAVIAYSALAPFPVEVVITDCDTDNNKLPDSWQHINHFGNTKKHSDVEEAHFSALSVPAESTTDTDGDGITDLEELILGLDPTNPDTNGDGINDSVARQLFGDAAEAGTDKALEIESINIVNGAPVISWKWANSGSTLTRLTTSAVAPTPRKTHGVVKAKTLATTISYVIEGKKSLNDNEWTTIKRVTSNLSTGEITVDEAKNGNFRFFRISVKSID